MTAPLPLTLTVPEAGRLFGLGRDAAYAAAARGEIPTLRMGRRLIVPTHKLLELLGVPADAQLTIPDSSEGGPASPPITVTDPHSMEQTHECKPKPACGTLSLLRNA